MTLSTWAEVDAELAATADYDVENDVSKAKRRVAALRRKLDFAASGEFDGKSLVFAQNIIQEQLHQALAFIRATDDVTEAQRMDDPSVLHADFSTFRGYQS